MRSFTAKPWVWTTLGFGGAILISWVVLAWALHLGSANLAEPFAYQGDALEWHILVKNTLETGWFLSNDRMGAPYGMGFYDYPQPEALYYLQVKLLGLFSDNPFLIVNLVYLLGFPLVTASSLWVCRNLRTSWPSAIVVSLLYTFVPYHFHRGEYHLWLAAYYTVPLLILVVLWACSAEPLVFDPGAPGLRPRWRLNRRRVLAAVVICVIGGSAGAYYAFFTCALLFLGALATSVGRRRLGSMWTALALIALIGATGAANLTPNMLHWLRAGRNPEVAARSYGESEFYGMKLTQLVVPVEGHRLAPLRALRERYDHHSQLRNENTESIGLVASLGFFSLLGWLFVRRRGPEEHIETVLSHLNLFALLIGTIGGLGALFAFTISPQIRAYNRISIFLAFIALLMVGLLLDRLVQYLAPHRHGRLLALAALTLVCVGGLLDEIPPGRAPNYAEAAAEHHSDADCFAALEARHSPGAMVFQLPYQPFPESANTHRSCDYDLARPFINTRAMRWSYGAIRDRFGDQHIREISEKPLPEMLELLALVGYEAIAVDRFGYADTTVETSLAGLLGAPEIVSRSQRFSIFDLRGFTAAFRARLGDAAWDLRAQQTQNPVLTRWSLGCWGPEGTDGDVFRWCDRTAELHIENHADHPRTLRVAFDVATGHRESANFALSGALLAGQFRVSQELTRVDRTLTVLPGSHAICMHTDARQVSAPMDPRTLYFRIEHFQLSELDQGNVGGK